MLAGLCRRLAADGWNVTVIGRDQAKLARATADDTRLHPLSVDYENVGAFVSAIAGEVEARGPIRLAVCWIRSWAPQALLAAADAVAPEARLFHVLGSHASDASAAAVDTLADRTTLRYRRVQLGAVGDRWLTNEEISAGVYEAIVADRPYHLVGTIS
jgi:NAD(P)-dependent dehydrogenase (short-subunit alcohol dehydrogenase family)